MAYHRPIPESKNRRASGMGGFGALVEAEKLMQIAFVMPSAVLIGWVGGWWLASVTHWKWVEIAGVLLGCAAGLLYVIEMAVAAEKKTMDKSQDAGPEAGKGSGDSEAQDGPGKGTDADQR